VVSRSKRLPVNSSHGQLVTPRQNTLSLKADCTTAQSGRPRMPTARTSYLSNYDRTANDVRFSRTGLDCSFLGGVRNTLRILICFRRYSLL